jgi:CheY-like chemotaxis protein
MVDDRVENLVALEAILEPLGHQLVRAVSGEEALRKVLLQEFAVILLDVQMPGMNGFETANFIKSRERSKHTPIIFLTAISKEEEYVFEGYSVGAVDYMFKPFNPVVLRSKVSVFVDLYLKGQQMRRQSELLRQSERRELELRHRAEMVESEARLANIVETARDAIISFGDDRRITLFNSAAEDIFGLPARAALGRSVARDPDLRHDPRRGRWRGSGRDRCHAAPGEQPGHSGGHWEAAGRQGVPGGALCLDARERCRHGAYRNRPRHLGAAGGGGDAPRSRRSRWPTPWRSCGC